jgi:hypothetical protein
VRFRVGRIGPVGRYRFNRSVSRRGRDFGVVIDGPIAVDMVRVKARKDEIVGQSNRGVTNWLKNAPNVTLIEGHGRFESPRTIRVNDRLLEAPEIFINTGGRPSVASDQFACGSVLWEALVGRKLFDGETDYETYCRLRDCAVQPLRPLRPDVPAAFAQIIHRALAGDADDRFPSTREMARQIGTALKKVQLRKDLHTVLAKTVVEARAVIGVGARPGEISEPTPLAEIVPDDAPRLEPPRTAEGAAAQALDRLRGLRHYLPFFGKKRG